MPHCTSKAFHHHPNHLFIYWMFYLHQLRFVLSWWWYQFRWRSYYTANDRVKVQCRGAMWCTWSGSVHDDILTDVCKDASQYSGRCLLHYSIAESEEEMDHDMRVSSPPAPPCFLCWCTLTPVHFQSLFTKEFELNQGARVCYEELKWFWLLAIYVLTKNTFMYLCSQLSQKQKQNT